jgi:hypothetical protein
MENDTFSIAIKFVAGGGIVAGGHQPARDADPGYGAFLVAAPITTTIAFLFTNYERGHATTQQLVPGAFYFAVPTFCSSHAFSS